MVDGVYDIASFTGVYAMDGDLTMLHLVLNQEEPAMCLRLMGLLMSIAPPASVRVC